jgi:hypothetical protein
MPVLIALEIPAVSSREFRRTTVYLSARAPLTVDAPGAAEVRVGISETGPGGDAKVVAAPTFSIAESGPVTEELCSLLSMSRVPEEVLTVSDSAICPVDPFARSFGDRLLSNNVYQLRA